MLMRNIATRLAGKVLNVVDPGNHVRRFRDYYFRSAWLGRVNNVVHVGANTGQEADMYAARGLGVLWIEPIPSVFHALEDNIRLFPQQRTKRSFQLNPERRYATHSIKRRPIFFDFRDGQRPEGNLARH